MFNLSWNDIVNPLDVGCAVTGLPGLGSAMGYDFPNTNEFMGGITDTLGLTDTQAPQRGLTALENRADQAVQNLDQDMLGVNQMYANAIKGRQMGDVLNRYDTNMMDTENAASAENVQNFMNPMYDRALTAAANKALGGAGSSLNSSAANNAVGTAVANQATSMWQQAFQNAIADAQNKQGIYNATTKMDLMPSLNWSQLQSDVAGTKFTKDMDIAQAAGQVAGRNQSWIGDLF